MFTVYFPAFNFDYDKATWWLKARGWDYYAQSCGHCWCFIVVGTRASELPPEPISWFKRNIIWKIKVGWLKRSHQEQQCVSES